LLTDVSVNNMQRGKITHMRERRCNAECDARCERAV
jgi:hypothetical protein